MSIFLREWSWGCLFVPDGFIVPYEIERMPSTNIEAFSEGNFSWCAIYLQQLQEWTIMLQNQYDTHIVISLQIQTL